MEVGDIYVISQSSSSLMPRALVRITNTEEPRAEILVAYTDASEGGILHPLEEFRYPTSVETRYTKMPIERADKIYDWSDSDEPQRVGEVLEILDVKQQRPWIRQEVRAVWKEEAVNSRGNIQ